MDFVTRAQENRYRPTLSRRPLLVRYYSGGICNAQVGPFETACRRVTESLKNVTQIKFEALSLRDLRKNDWELREFVDWLLSSHIHFILGYVHQGLEGFGWDMRDLYKELQRLRFHEGFPNSSKLSCPIFTQDKIEYLRLIDDVTLPTYSIDLPNDSGDFVYEEYHKKIEWYLFIIISANIYIYNDVTLCLCRQYRKQ